MIPSEIDDGQLLEKARVRDEWGKLIAPAREALSQLYDRHSRRLIAYLCAQFPGRGEDLSHSVWLKVLDPGAKFAGGQFRAWLFRIGYNLGISELRKNRLRSAADDADPAEDRQSVLQDWVNSEEGRIVDECVEKLLPLEREVVFRWKYREKHQEIAQALGITRSKSEQLQFAAMTKLRDCAEAAS